MADRDLSDQSTVPHQAPSSEALFGAALGEGAQVGPYIIESGGRRGGFATVYRVRHYRDGGPPAALKVLHQALCGSAKMLQRFEREIETLRRVRHPGIVEVIDCGSLPDGRSFYVMPWIEGTPLDELIAARGALSPPEVLALFDQLVAALGAAHAQGIVHRDIKPANMVIAAEPDGSLYLLDFGIAKIVSDDETHRHDLTSTGTYVGTPYYMAPEQIRGDEIGVATDVYALGVVLFQLATGRLPFTAPTPLEVEMHHLHTPPPRPSDRARVPAGFDEVVACCLAKAPAARFASAGDLLAALRAVIGGAAPGAPEPPEVVVVGLHVEASLLGAELGDDEIDAQIDELDDVVAAARARCVAAGLELAVTGGRTFVAVLPAARDPADAVALGLELAATGTGTVRLTATVHRAAAIRDPGGELVGGELARLVDWIAEPSRTGVWATDAALDGIAERFDVTDAGSPRQILARR